MEKYLESLNEEVRKYFKILSPVFKQCVDFMEGDSEKQESTEEKIYRITDVSKSANIDINNFLNMKLHQYIGLNFKNKV